MVKDQDTQYESVPGQLLDAHYKFFQDVAAASEDLQQRVHTLQLEYQTAFMRASQSQRAEDAEAAMQAWQRLMQTSLTDVDLPDRIREAYHNYVHAIGAVLAGGDIDALDPSTLITMSQSMAAVATCASQWAGAAPADEAATTDAGTDFP